MRKPPPRDGIRVASVPAGHPYVRALELERAGIRVLPDPPVPGAPPDRWWPPVMLEPAWIAAHAGEFDLMHVHFGVESRSLAALAQTLAALHAAARPLVHTVHDLVHPQLDLAGQAHHTAQLGALVAAAEALITLTPGAAAAIADRYGRRARVIPHPAMLPADAPAPIAAAGVPWIGVHLRDLRPGIDGPGTVRTLAGALAGLAGGARGVVWLHDRVRDPAGAAAVRRDCAAAGIALHEGPRPDDATLQGQLAGLAASLVPYRHGTHSGWVELCWDLAVPVLAPDVGYLAEQHPDGVTSFSAGDVPSLTRALRTLLATPLAVPGSPARAVARRRRSAGRREAAGAAASAHAEVYAAVLMKS